MHCHKRGICDICSEYLHAIEQRLSEKKGNFSREWGSDKIQGAPRGMRVSYQLSIILGTAISLRKFHWALFGPISVRFPLLFSPWWRPSLTSKGSQPEKGKADRRYVRIVPSIIFTREGTRVGKRKGGFLCSDLLSRMPVGHLH